MINRSYNFKFHITARHFITINDIPGDIHPHSWEINLTLVKESENFIRFDYIERIVIDYLSSYDDCLMNDMPSFAHVCPTSEVISEVIFQELNDLLRDKDWQIIRLDLSENASRTYTITDRRNAFGGYDPLKNAKLRVIPPANDKKQTRKSRVEASHINLVTNDSPTHHGGFDHFMPPSYLTPPHSESIDTTFKGMYTASNSGPTPQLKAVYDPEPVTDTYETLDFEHAFFQQHKPFSQPVEKLSAKSPYEHEYIGHDDVPKRKTNDFSEAVSLDPAETQFFNQINQTDIEKLEKYIALRKAHDLLYKSSQLEFTPKQTVHPTEHMLKTPSKPKAKKQKPWQKKNGINTYKDPFIKKNALILGMFFSVLMTIAFMLLANGNVHNSFLFRLLLPSELSVDESFRSLSPLFSSSWLTSMEPALFWGPLPLMLLGNLRELRTEWLGLITSLCLPLVMLFGALPWYRLGKFYQKKWLGALCMLIWMFNPFHLSLFLFEGNLPLMMTLTWVPYLLMQVTFYRKDKETVRLPIIAFVFLIISLSHLLLAAELFLALGLYALSEVVLNNRSKHAFLLILALSLAGMVAVIGLVPVLYQATPFALPFSNLHGLAYLLASVQQALSYMLSGYHHVFASSLLGASLLFYSLTGLLSDQRSRSSFLVSIALLTLSAQVLTPIVTRLTGTPQNSLMLVLSVVGAFVLLGTLQWQDFKGTFKKLIILDWK